MKRNLFSILTIVAVLFAFTQEGIAQKTITGSVYEENGPLPGATVTIKGTSTGTQTDFDGNYTLNNVTSDNVLVFSYVGYTPKEVVVGAQSSIDVTLASDNTLDEVVVVGYGTQKKSSVTSSVATIKAEDLAQVPLATFDQILQGRLTGIEVSSGSGQPGTAANVRIRGTSSILGNSTPLYIVDGIAIDPNSFASLNANDFESVSVLKDAQATSLYGARGAAGVIVINTKKGSFGASKTTISVRSFTGISVAPRLQEDVLNARQFIELSRTLGFNGFGNSTDAEINQIIDDLGNFEVNDALLRVGQTISQEISATGGSENTSFFASIGYFEQEGTVENSDLQRLTTRLNLGHKFNDKFNFDLNTSVGFSRINSVPSNGGVNLANPFLLPFLGNPTVPVFNEDGTFNTGNPTLSRAAPNVLEDLRFGIRENEELKIITSLRATYKFTDWLNVSYNVGIDFEDDFNVNALNPNTFRGQTIPAITDAAGGLFGQQTETSIRDLNFTSTLSLNFNKTFKDKHVVNASAFFEVNNRDFRSSNFTGFALEPALFGFANAITQGTVDNGLIPTVGGFRTRNGLVSVFATGDYNYDDRFGFAASVRSDRSSRIDPEFSDIAFFSVSGRWSLENESFLENSDWIDQLKIRASYGTTGNDASAANNGFIQQLGRPIFLGVPGFVLGGLANTTSRWEFTRQFNAGLDFGFWKGKLSGTFDYYTSTTEDLNVVLTLPASFGDTAVPTNIGSIENEGVELALDFNLVNTKDWQLNIFGNASYNFGRVTDLGPQIDQFVNGTSIVRVGEQLGSHFVVEFAGVNPANGEPLYRDLDGNITNVFDGDDARTGFGSSDPLYTGGFGFNANYKGFGLSTLFSFQAEVNRFNNTSFFLENNNFLSGGLNQSTSVLDFFQNVGDITDTPAPFVNGVATQRQFSSQDIEDASFIRLRDITLSYTFNEKILKNTVLQNARVYARGVNLLTFTNFTGLDPEDNNNISQFEFPNAAQYTFGLDLSF
jgi:TonB-linked SusC/RagA family outer membrane protein